MKKLAILILFCKACAPVPENQTTPAPSGASQAVSAAVGFLGKVTGYKIKKVPTISWYKGCLKLEYDSRDCMQGFTTTGYALEDAKIHLVYPEPFFWENTSLCHELIHYLLWEKTGNSDTNHTNKLFSGSYIGACQRVVAGE